MPGPFDFVADFTLGVFGEAVEVRPLEGSTRQAVGVVTRSGVDALGVMATETRVSVASAEAADLDGGEILIGGAVYRICAVDLLQGGRASLLIEGPFG